MKLLPENPAEKLQMSKRYINQHVKTVNTSGELESGATIRMEVAKATLEIIRLHEYLHSSNQLQDAKIQKEIVKKVAEIVRPKLGLLFDDLGNDIEILNYSSHVKHELENKTAWLKEAARHENSSHFRLASGPFALWPQTL